MTVPRADSNRNGSTKGCRAFWRLDARRFPTLHDLAAELAEDHWEDEFETGLSHMLDRIESFVARGPDTGRD